MPKQELTLRPATRRVHQYLLADPDHSIDATIPNLVRVLGLAERTVRRAIRELERGGFVSCERTSTHHKKVTMTTQTAVQTGPKPAQNRPKTGQNRPKPAHARSSFLDLESKRCCSSERRPREATLPPQQHQQQRLALSGFANDKDRHVAAKAIKDLNKELGPVWTRLGRRYGFLSVNDATVEGMINALANYPWDELVGCVVWSAERLADGLLGGGLFATTFRGNAFCDRHRQWHEHLERTDRERRRAAAEPAPTGPALDGSELEQRAASVLGRLRGQS